MTQLAYCGLDCGTCEFRPAKCSGCQAAGGKVHWGECELATCCMSKKLEHCGKCSDFPCETLKAFAFDPGFGENGKRIENLRRA